MTGGKLTVDEWADAFDKRLLDGHYNALVLGHERAGNFDYDSDALRLEARGIKDTEGEFLQNWVDQIKAGDPRYIDDDGNFIPGSLDSRSDLYGGKLRGTANEAFVEGSPSQSTFDWELGAGDHCKDCPELAALGPYTSETLITTPGSGDTECITNCTCLLVRDDGMTGFDPVDASSFALLVTRLKRWGRALFRA